MMTMIMYVCSQDLIVLATRPYTRLACARRLHEICRLAFPEVKSGARTFIRREMEV